MARDGLTLFYSGSAGADYGLVTASRADTTSAFGAASIVPGLNIGAGSRPSWLSDDGLRLYFHVLDGSEWDLYVTERSSTSSMFGAPSDAPFSLINSSSSELEATFTADELQMFFASDRTGSLGDTDIWWSSRPTLSDPFGTPINITAVNTIEEEGHPLFFGGSLYFSSRRDNPGSDYNGQDIFRAAVVPEPSALAVWSFLGIVGIGYGWQRKRRSR